VPRMGLGSLGRVYDTWEQPPEWPVAPPHGHRPHRSTMVKSDSATSSRDGGPPGRRGESPPSLVLSPASPWMDLRRIRGWIRRGAAVAAAGRFQPSGEMALAQNGFTAAPRGLRSLEDIRMDHNTRLVPQRCSPPHPSPSAKTFSVNRHRPMEGKNRRGTTWILA
jgi:hypothetical protein